MRTAKHTTLMGAAAVLGLAASGALGQITGSDHDFSSNAWADGEICKPCHTPHFAIEGLPRLWNHELTVATYTMHEGTGTAEDDFDVVSRMCLSCHDGTVALDSFGGQTGSTNIPTGANLGTDLVNDHPVGSDGLYYASTDADKPSFWDGAFRPVTNPTGTRPTVGSLRLKKWDDGTGTIRNVVGCTTCHEPHNRGGYDHLLAIDNSASAVCLSCHIK